MRNPHNAGVTLQLRHAEDAVRATGLEVQVAEARAPEEFETAFARFGANDIKGVVLQAVVRVSRQCGL